MLAAPGPHQERTPDFQVFNLYGKDVPSYEELLNYRDHMVSKHPRTTFIAAHLGNQAMILPRSPKCSINTLTFTLISPPGTTKSVVNPASL